MRIVVTGASGNVGTALRSRLVDDGHDVVALARRPPDPTASDVTWRAIDLTDDGCRSALGDAFRGADAVVHLAWGFQPSHDERYLEELGVGGTRRVLDAVARTGVPHLVHMSSLGAYSPKVDDRPVDESWPTFGVRSSMYSRHKVAAERLLDAHEAAGHGTVLTRMRPGIIGQRSAASALLRYGLPALLPARVIDLVPVLPLDRRLLFQVVHADDVADAFARALAQQAPGAFNLVSDPPVTTGMIAELLGARPLHVPSPLVRAAVAGSWRLHLQQVDPGWWDLGMAVPLLDASRASRELGWQPSVDAAGVLGEVLAGMRDAAAGRTPVLRPRSVAAALRDAVRRGPVGQRHRT